jgi:hypothetical protein
MENRFYNIHMIWFCEDIPTLQFKLCNYVQVIADRDYVPGEQVIYYSIENYILSLILISFVLVVAL